MGVREDFKDELRYRNKLLFWLLNAYVVITPTSTAQQNIFYRFCLLVLALEVRSFRRFGEHSSLWNDANAEKRNRHQHFTAILH
jgi:hypothetical protein